MKKITSFIAIALAISIGVATIAPVAQAATQKTSYQTYSVLSNYLVVYETNDPKSGICYQGVVEDYDGTCVSPTAAPWQHREKQEMLRRNR